MKFAYAYHAFKNIRLNHQIKLFEVAEAGTKYEFDSLMLNDLNIYLKQNLYLQIADSYRSLEFREKDKVKKSPAY